RPPAGGPGADPARPGGRDHSTGESPPRRGGAAGLRGARNSFVRWSSFRMSPSLWSHSVALRGRVPDRRLADRVPPRADFETPSTRKEFTVDASEFVYWIAVTDGCVEQMPHEHARADDTRKRCGKTRPCNMRRRAIEALDMQKSWLPSTNAPRSPNSAPS